MGLLLGLAGLACLTPLLPQALHLALWLTGALAALAGWDATRAWRRARAEASVLGEDGAPAAIIRMTLGRPAALRLQLHWRGARSARMALLAASPAFAAAIELPPDSLPFALAAESRQEARLHRLPEIAVNGRVRGRHRGLRCGWEQASPLGLWRLQQWQTLPCEFAVYPDLAPGRRVLLRSPVFRALAAATQLPMTGQGREFERLREYQPGDTYADVSWKATARRAYPVTRLYQWEQQQEIYFVLDHSRLSRAWLDLFIETALVGATAARDIGDRFGLVTYADGVTHWLGASSGVAHFNACREILLGLAPAPVTPDAERLSAALRARLRRRCYVLLLANLTERGQGEAFLGAARLLARTHAVLAHSPLPAEARPLFSGPPAADLDGMYAALAGDIELARLETLRARLARVGIEFRATPPRDFLAAACGGYLAAKQEQRL